MARDINIRLRQLETRRKGTDHLNRMAMDSQREVLAKSLMTESWEKRQGNKPFTRYAIGSMQEVGPDYTRISLETARRVGAQLNQGLSGGGYSVDFRLQGSVPLNVHIRGVSDVDLLNLDTSFRTYDAAGAWSRRGLYTSPTSQTSLGVLTSLRKEAEKILKAKYPAADVDCTGGKAINISGGSLARPVDVVVSHWHDCTDYQQSEQEHDRGVTILDKKVPTTIANLPFLHIKRLTDRDISVAGGLKKAIRLCKNVRSDAEKDIALPSFDIAALMYHADQNVLRAGCVYELAILAEAQRFFDYLHHNKEYAKSLVVPDGSRKVLNTPEKVAAVTNLSIELDDLLLNVAKEQRSPLTPRYSLSDDRAAVSSVYIPAAPQ